MRIKKHFALLLSLSLVLAGLACCDKNSNKNNKLTTKANITVLQNNGIKKLTLKPLADMPQYTNLIGTTETPTIDGGIINTADGININIVNENLPKKALAIKEPKDLQRPKTLPVAKKENLETTVPFSDSWATSKRVEKMLQQAASSGKLSYVLKKSSQKGLPASVATLPMLESNYEDNALSSKGAFGTWQLMPITAQDYGVSKNERNKFQPSTEAALRFLSDLHNQFGNWQLSFAAYNAGAKRVKLALLKNPQARSVQDLDLPQETKNYVSHIMALNQAIAAL